MTKKQTQKPRHQSRKVYPDILPKQRYILSMVAYTQLTPVTMAEKLRYITKEKWNRQKVSYHLGILLKRKYILDPNPELNKWKIYDITRLGQDYLDEYDKTHRYEKRGIENARHKVEIKDTTNLRRFLEKPEYQFKLNSQMKNIDEMWDGQVAEFSVKITIANKTTMVVTPPPFYDVDEISGHIKIRDDVIAFLNKLNSQYGFNMGMVQRIPTNQYTLSNELAKQAMKFTNNSQLKIDGGRISLDSSHHSEPRFEARELQDFVDEVNLPNMVKKLFAFQNENHNELKEGLLALAEAMNKANTMNNEIQKGMLDKITDLTNIVTGQNQGRVEQNSAKSELNDDVKHMYG